MKPRTPVALPLLLAVLSSAASAPATPAASPGTPYLVVLGIAQDAGVPQAGSEHPAWDDPALRRHATSLALVDPRAKKRWLFEATPDFKHQLRALDRNAPADGARPGLDGIFLTHAHVGHYTGLMMLGHEAMGARGVPVYAMPRMRRFLEENGPWDQLVRYENVALRPLEADRPVTLGPGLRVTPFPVPHRQEYTEVVGYRIEGPRRKAIFLPDVDRWADWDRDLANVLAGVDAAYLDGTFYADGEIPGRDMSSFPHPRILATMQKLARLPAAERAKVRFIHFNHTNPVLIPGSAARREVAARGFRLAEEGEVFEL